MRITNATWSPYQEKGSTQPERGNKENCETGEQGKTVRQGNKESCEENCKRGTKENCEMGVQGKL